MIDRETLGFFDTLHFAQPPAPPDVSAYSRIYAFGDSLSDAGNDFSASQGVLPDPLIYSDGRFTNGRVWVQDLARDLHLAAVTPSLNGGTDFAYGGAETGQEPLHGALPIDLPSQLAQFAVQDPHPSVRALYTLSIGGNDVIDAIGAYGNNPAGALADVRAAVGNETSFVAGLAADGARNFAILNVPDLGKTPEESHAATASQLASLYNQELASSLGSLALADHLSIHLIDAFGLIDQAVAHPARFGLTNVTGPVWTGDFVNPLSGHLNAVGQAAQDRFLFFDHLHPTETGHLALASAALSALR